MDDDLGIFDQFGDDRRQPGRRQPGRRAPQRRGPDRRAPNRQAMRQMRERQRREQRRKRNILLIGGAFVVILGLIVAYIGIKEIRDAGLGKDYSGTGESDVIIEVSSGDSTSAIASTLRKADVVASTRAFNRKSDDVDGIRDVQPGFYKMKTRMSAANAAALLVDPESRVGRLEIRAGYQLDDVQLPNGETSAGIVTRLSQASCADLNGSSSCVSADELRSVMEQTSATDLGVPDWARNAVEQVEPGRKLEGLVAAGNYDVRPGSTAIELWQQVMQSSTVALQAAGMPDAAEGAPGDYGPYQVLVIASIIEREAITKDFEKISRVIYNRLDVNMPLQMDSTINYPLDRPTIRTSGEDRGRAGPYNSYLNTGLPPTPIGAPSKDAVKAAEKPAEGPWIYFVKCENDGTSCFNVGLPEHEAATRDAAARGVF